MKSKILRQNLAVATTVAVVLGLLSSSSYCVEAQVPEGTPLTRPIINQLSNLIRDDLDVGSSEEAQNPEGRGDGVVVSPPKAMLQKLDSKVKLLGSLGQRYGPEIRAALEDYLDQSETGTEDGRVVTDFSSILTNAEPEDSDFWDLTSQISLAISLVEDSPEDPFDSDFGGGSSWMITDERDRAGL